MQEKSLSLPRNKAFIDLLIIFIPQGLLILFNNAINNEWVATIGRVMLIGLTLWVINWRDGRWSKLGIVRPTKILRTIFLSFGLILITIVVAGTAEEIILNFPGSNIGRPDFNRFANLEGNLPLLLVWLVNIWVTVAIGEELIWRAFLTDRLGTVLDNVNYQNILVVLIGASMFGLAHFYQGTLGIITTGLSGLVYILAYQLSGRNLWLVIIAHGLSNTLSLISVYLGRI